MNDSGDVLNAMVHCSLYGDAVVSMTLSQQESCAFKLLVGWGVSVQSFWSMQYLLFGFYVVAYVSAQKKLNLTEYRTQATYCTICV